MRILGSSAARWPGARSPQGLAAFGAVATAVLAIAGLGAGCRAPAEVTGPTEIVLRVGDYEGFIDNTLTLLREQDFAPQRVDRETGHIECEPCTGQQWFEFWRTDSHGAYQLAESSIHTVRRVVTVDVVAVPVNHIASEGTVTESRVAGAPQTAPASSGGAGGAAPNAAPTLARRFHVTVQVDKSRYSAPERQVTTASGAIGMYSSRLPTEEGIRVPRRAAERWVPLGRDGLLEAYLLARIAALPSAEPEQ